MDKIRFHRNGTLPNHEEIFTFGSNLAGRHGKGAAREALLNYGAIYGIGIGKQNRSYAIPTKDHDLRVIELEGIRRYILEFEQYVKIRHDLTFFITAIGTGYAGYRHEDIAPLFTAMARCNYPIEWKDLLTIERT